MTSSQARVLIVNDNAEMVAILRDILSVGPHSRLPRRRSHDDQEPLTGSTGEKVARVSNTRSRQGKEAPDGVPTLRWIDGT